MQRGQATDHTVFEILAQTGFYAEPASTNDFTVRVNSLDRLLTQLIDGEPGVLIHPRCKTLIRGLSGDYHYKRLQVSNDERYQDKPNKNFASHVCESLHYLLLGGDSSLLSVSAEWEAANEELQGSWAPPAYYYE